MLEEPSGHSFLGAADDFPAIDLDLVAGRVGEAGHIPSCIRRRGRPRQSRLESHFFEAADEAGRDEPVGFGQGRVKTSPCRKRQRNR